jgi:hypothetical protein
MMPGYLKRGVLIVLAAVYTYWTMYLLNAAPPVSASVGFVRPFYAGIVLAPLAFFAGRAGMRAWIVTFSLIVFSYITMLPLHYQNPPFVRDESWLDKVAWLPVVILFNGPFVVLPAFLAGRYVGAQHNRQPALNSDEKSL